MVQVLENNRKPSFLTSVATGVSSQLPTVLQDLVSRKKEQRALDLKEKQNKALLDKYPEYAPFIDHPELLKVVVGQKLKDDSNKALMQSLGILPKDPSSQGGNITNLMQSLGGQGQQDQQMQPQEQMQPSSQGADIVNQLMQSLSSQQPQEQPQMQQPMQPPMQQPQQFQPNQSTAKTFTPQQLAGLSVTNPQVANSLMKQQEMEQRETLAKQKQDLAEKKFQHTTEENLKNREAKEAALTREETLQAHKESIDYANKIYDQADVAKKQINAIEDTLKSVENVKPTNVASFLKGRGPLSDKIANIFMTGDQAKINANIPYLLEGWKDIFGVRLSDADLKILEDKLPNISKSAEANKAILGVLKKYAQIPIQKEAIAKRILKENNGYYPRGFREKVSDELEAWSNSMHTIQGPKTAHGEETVKIFDPKTNTTRNIPRSKYDAAIKAGGQPVYE